MTDMEHVDTDNPIPNENILDRHILAHSDSNGTPAVLYATHIFDCCVCFKPLSLPIYQRLHRCSSCRAWIWRETIAEFSLTRSIGSATVAPIEDLWFDVQNLKDTICRIYGSSPFLNNKCFNGHLACSNCHPKVRKRCYICSLPFGDNRCRAVEEVLQSMDIACTNKAYGCKEVMKYHGKYAHEKSCVFKPCPCPQPGCDFRASYKDFSSHFRTTHRLCQRGFNYDEINVTSIHHDEEILVLQELNDGTLFVINNKVEQLGNIITLCHITPSTMNLKFSFEMVARSLKGKSSYLLDAKAQNVQEDRTSSSFLLVPSEFFQPSGWLALEICISKINGAA